MSDLVVISLEPWDDVWRRNQHIVAGLLRSQPGLRVLFVAPPTDPIHAMRQRRRPHRGSGLQEVRLDGQKPGNRLWAFQSTKWLPRRLAPGSDGGRAREIVKLAKRLGFVRPVLWVNDPFGAEVLELTGWRSLYDLTDDWLAADRPQRETERIIAQERRLLAGVDAVVACSQVLQAKAPEFRPAVLIPNAVDTSAYGVLQERPTDLPDGPYALYVGTLHRDRLDIDLCRETAQEVRPIGELILLGPVALDRDDVETLETGGVRLLGARPRGSVPAYLQHASVLVVPHVLSDFTESLDPIKAYEYQAAGRPVVSVAVPGFRDAASPQVHVVTSNDFARVVADVLANPPPTVTRTGTPDWAERVADFAGVLLQLDAR